MRELAARYERQTNHAAGATPRARTGARTRDKEWRAAICAMMVLVLGLLTLGAFATHDVVQKSQPNDEELTTRFFSHVAIFDELVQMLATDRPSLAAKGAAAIDLATMGRFQDAARLGKYRGLLRRISVEDLRYFPASGKLLLVPDGQKNPEHPSESYLYLPFAHTQSLGSHYSYDWRAPGINILTGDRPLKGAWFVHHDTTIEVAVSPY